MANWAKAGGHEGGTFALNDCRNIKQGIRKVEKNERMKERSDNEGKIRGREGMAIISERYQQL